jgi:hypothetical protein
MVDPPDSQFGSSDVPTRHLVSYLCVAMREGRSFEPLEILSDCVEDRNLRAVLVGMLRERA